MQVFHLHARRRRAQGATVAMWLVLATLIAAFFTTQVVRNPAYAMQSDRNRLRALTLPPPRGTIVDRNGRIVADNLPGYALTLLPAPQDSLRATLDRLAPLLGLSEAGISRLLERHGRHPQQQLVVSTDLSFDRVSAIEERRPQFPEVLIDMRPKRHYPAGAAAAHLVGYVGEISEAELGDPAFADYRAGQMVGKTGVEREYEAALTGEPGVRYVEVDALGRVVGDFTGPGEAPPVPGRSLQLSIDLDLQEWIARILPDTVRGAVVALEPETGAVLALYSAPSFDPNALVGNVSPEQWSAVAQDSAKPLLNRATTGLYPPGSTWKLATAAIALELGIVTPEQTLPLACRGGMRYGNRYFRCWDHNGHGYLDLPDAIKNSCDVYFYQVGLQIGLDRLLKEGVRLGFNRATGIDLPVERAGHFPGGREWYERRFGWAATESEVLSLSIGQGANDQTPLKMAQFFAALATDGRAPAPRVLAAVLPPATAPALAGDPAGVGRAEGAAGGGEGEPVAADGVWAMDAAGAAAGGAGGDSLDLRVSPSHLKWLREGLRRVVSEGGTAYASALEHWDWVGKTGTAQNPHGPDHAWFVGIGGPRDGDPEVVVAAIIEAGQHGSDAAQVAAKVADYYLRKTHGMPIDTIQTLREHWLAGRPAPWAP